MLLRGWEDSFGEQFECIQVALWEWGGNCIVEASKSRRVFKHRKFSSLERSVIKCQCVPYDETWGLVGGHDEDLLSQLWKRWSSRITMHCTLKKALINAYFSWQFHCLGCPGAYGPIHVFVELTIASHTSFHSKTAYSLHVVVIWPTEFFVNSTKSAECMRSPFSITNRRPCNAKKRWICHMSVVRVWTFTASAFASVYTSPSLHSNFWKDISIYKNMTVFWKVQQAILAGV